MRLKYIITATAVTAALAMGSVASAATVGYATGVTQTGGPGDTGCFVQTNDASRTNICNALGAPDGDFANGVGNGFVSAGNFGNLEFTFANNFTGPITIWEITGPGGPFGEALDAMAFFAEGIGGETIEGIVSSGGTPVAGTTSRYEISFGLPDAIYSRFIVAVDPDGLETPDGFDIDAISAHVIPLPAAGWLLLGGIGGLAAMKRRKKA